ncbi:hypothetical protein R3I93_009482 [Phoxinus phoxinus]|uniref:Uncharacterized protein n=1 Tax=Phoxinus phoxinus TaxID=58324 RepID=A0AAN9D5A8_9TELE
MLSWYGWPITYGITTQFPAGRAGTCGVWSSSLISDPDKHKDSIDRSQMVQLPRHFFCEIHLYIHTACGNYTGPDRKSTTWCPG